VSQKKHKAGCRILGNRLLLPWFSLKRLGYTRYVAQGGDWGSPVSSAMARQAIRPAGPLHKSFIIRRNLVYLIPMLTSKLLSRRSVAHMARQHAEKAICTLVACLDDEDARVRLDAAKQILDRGIGKPIAMTAEVTDRFDDWTDEQLDAAIDMLEREIAAATEAETREVEGATEPGTDVRH
jgi:hypothetical protein